MKKRPIIIDCDPGTDDTFAILLAASRPEFDIKAINPVVGNVPYEFTSKNALRLKDMLGLDTRVGVGADRPLIEDKAGRTAEYIHGEGGLGGFTLKEATSKFDKDYAWDILYEEAKKAEGELEVVALGPLTNIALAILRYPALKDLIKKITIMGGSATYGNVGAYAEFNIWVDPDACEVVLKSGIEIDLCGLDGLNDGAFLIEEFNQLVSASEKIEKFSKGLMGRYIKYLENLGRSSFSIYDLLTMAIFINPKIGEFKRFYVTTETKSSLSKGQTIVDKYFISDNKPNVNVLISSNKTLYLELLKEMIDFYI